MQAYLLKCQPDDFRVEEIPNWTAQRRGPYQILKLTKQNLTTEHAAAKICEKLRVPRAYLSYAGTKDRMAITTQFITLKGGTLQKILVAEGLRAEPVGYLSVPLSLGDLQGNTFAITLRGLSKKPPAYFPTEMPNYFDSQRFSTQNVTVGLLLLTKQFARAATIIANTNLDVQAQLSREPTDGLRAVQLLPRHLVRMYLHAYQSHIFNRLLANFIQQTEPYNELEGVDGPLRFPTTSLTLADVPLPGFDLETSGHALHQQMMQLLQQDGLSIRDFVIRQLPNLSLAGQWRAATVTITDQILDPPCHDELHPGRQKAIVRFSLPKGAYATMAIKNWFAATTIPSES